MTNLANINIEETDILNSEDLLIISGGEIVVSSGDAAGIAHRSAQLLEGIVKSWNAFCSGFSSGYKDHIK
ncbi:MULTISPECIES: hypothetical protein [Dyadobacter]|uniref:Uncharacterized protein n=1 Tax=Dyadobacter jejuensis TaxID=1082580 RepID=A0A316A7A6_9BACT|nr:MULTISPECIES: hypothetical protein [Dyadobacter]PWJ52860.1 hypothetical protein CLV98_1307 [Dyadobacter jejuensis]